MPNHFTTRCVITGDDADIAAFRSAVFSRDEDGERLDFEKAIQIPECFSGEDNVCSTTNDVLALLCKPIGMNIIWDNLARHRPQMGEWRGLFNYKRGETQEILESAFPGEIARAKRAAICFGTTGHFDIISWAHANWGTKWNSYRLRFNDEQPGRLAISFETANGFPRPIFNKLAELFPRLKFECAYFDEGWNAAGRGFFNGSDGDAPFADEPATDDLYEIVYGEPPVHDDEEEDDLLSL